MIDDLEICIYCLGAYGIRTYLGLRDHGIRVKCFGDIDIKKKGYALDDIQCLSYQEILNKDKEKTCIIVCNQRADRIIEQFKEYGFQHVISDRELGEYTLTVYESIDYANAEVINRINEFRDKLYHCYVKRESVVWLESDSFDLELGKILKNTQAYIKDEK